MPTLDIQNVLEHRAQVEAFQRKHRIGLLTLLFTDIVGSTRIKQSLGDREGFDRIQSHHSAVRETLKQFPEGEEISTSGDSFFIVFAKPSEAVKFALLLQSRLRALAQQSVDAVFDRIGIHIGEVIIEEGAGASKKDLYGMQVDICGRVMSVGEGDQILMTRSTFDNARQVLKGKDVPGLRNLVWLNHGAYAMQGVEEPLEICEVGEEGVARLHPPADTEKVRRFVTAGRVSVDSAGARTSNIDGATSAARGGGLGWAAAGVLLLVAAVAVPTYLLSRNKSSADAKPDAGTAVERIGFETAEGYVAGQPLIDQRGWRRGKWSGQLDSGGQGVATGLFGNSSQQAFIGGVAGATVPGMHAAVSRQLVFSPSRGRNTVEITWKQIIKPSTNEVGNRFEWLFYNQSGQMLCGLIFDNANHRVARRFSDNSTAPTALTFKEGEVMDVALRLELDQNRWSATIGNQSLPQKSLGQQNRSTDLGSMAITWLSVANNARTPGGPVSGDNLLAFDDFVVTALPD